MISKIFGNSIQDSFKSFNIYPKNEGHLIGCSASNNGYVKKFGCSHKREIYLDKENNYLKGTDHIFKAKMGSQLDMLFDFTLILSSMWLKL